MTAKTRKNIHFRILFRTETETEPNHAQYFFRIAQEFHGMAVALKIGTLTHGKKADLSRANRWRKIGYARHVQPYEMYAKQNQIAESVSLASRRIKLMVFSSVFRCHIAILQRKSAAIALALFHGLNKRKSEFRECARQRANF